MNGLFSRTPSPAAVRPLLGAATLSVVEAVLVLLVTQVPTLLRLGAAGIIALTMLALAAGLRGERSPDDREAH